MTDLFLMGIFILCIVTGYILVKRSGGFLEQMLFQKPEVWYHQKDDKKIKKRSLSEYVRKHRLDRVEKCVSKDRGMKEIKAGIKHEWKADSRRPKQQVWKPQ